MTDVEEQQGAEPAPSRSGPGRVFLLSPANLGGLRAKMLTSKRAMFATAVAYRSPEGVPVADAFAFMSALYFRGKIAYARRFANPPSTIAGDGVFVIAPGFGLVPSDWILTPERVNRMKRVPIDLKSATYRKALERSAKELLPQLEPDSIVVLLGSIATGKYVDILRPILGDRLRFPLSFVGIGDMSRGGLMLAAARSGVELEYSTLDVERHRKRG